MKLNLGCGHDHLPGWVNVDRAPDTRPDLLHDLERFPWPFEDGCAEEVLLKHTLEHLGRDSKVFLGIMRELYRVCAPGATVRVVAHHPRHRAFLQDPTQVRPVLAGTFEHFSLDCNEDWSRRGLPATPLALQLEVDFRIESVTPELDPWWEDELQAGRTTRDRVERAMRDSNDVVRSTAIVLQAQKPFRGLPPQSAPAVRWEGAQFVYHSLAHVNRQLCLALLRTRKVNLSLMQYEPDQFDPLRRARLPAPGGLPEPQPGRTGPGARAAPVAAPVRPPRRGGLGADPAVGIRRHPPGVGRAHAGPGGRDLGPDRLAQGLLRPQRDPRRQGGGGPQRRGRRGVPPRGPRASPSRPPRPASSSTSATPSTARASMCCWRPTCGPSGPTTTSAW